ncbi:MAG: dependent oxidoreductase [Thermoleophilia bacterium]|nr:dependent oxidoreductase [Thermoleophilia bacterium]
MERPQPSAPLPESLDVLVVGAGISGISAAVHLRQRLPHMRWAIAEARDAIGGTWDLFRFPGVRSDSDMHTLGFGFRPWAGDTMLSDGASIRAYIAETAAEYGLDEHIRFGCRVMAASWSSETARWTVRLKRTDGDDQVVTCRYLFAGTGYFDYEGGYLPPFDGVERFEGTFVHAQGWPEELGCDGARVVVIGSGATAVTLVPALARRAAHVTMLQRTPSYILSIGARDRFAPLLRRLGRDRAARWARRKNVALAGALYAVSQHFPKLARRVLLQRVRRELPEGYDVERNFGPPYDPWDQRLCIVPDADIFAAIRSGAASVVTDRIAQFEEHGIRLASGELLEADVVVAATGLQLKLLGGIELEVDGRRVEPAACVTYRGMLLSGVPNLVFALGYTNASWTLRVDLVWEHAVRLVEEVHARGADGFVAQRPPEGDALAPLMALTSGYVTRAKHLLPRQGTSGAWRTPRTYWREARALRGSPLAEPGLELLRATDQPSDPEAS